MTTATVVLDDARIEYTDTGAGSPVVFVHGAYVTGALWDDVIASLSAHHRCIAPTWPFGAQRQPVGDGVDVGVIAAGRRIIALLDELDLRDVTLVANDSGGGVLLSALGILGLDWSLVSRLVFTNCDSFEHFPPKSFAPLVKLCRASGTAGALALRALATPPGLAFFKRAVTKNGIAAERDPAIFGGFLRSGEVRRDAVRFSAALNPPTLPPPPRLSRSGPSRCCWCGEPRTTCSPSATPNASPAPFLTRPCGSSKAARLTSCWIVPTKPPRPSRHSLRDHRDGHHRRTARRRRGDPAG